MSTAIVESRKPSLLQAMADDRSISPDNFLAAIKSTVFPANGTDAHLMAYLMVAHKYGLDPLLREIYAFPTKGGGIMPIVGVDGWSAIANRQPQYDGLEFEENFDDKGRIQSITTKIYRKDRNHPTVVTEYLSECQRDTEPWKKWPIRMLRHKSFIQCVRVAFSVSGIVDEDEAVRIDPSLAPIIEAGATTPEEQEAERLMETLQWNPEKRRMCRVQYNGRRDAQLQYLRAEVEKLDRLKPAAEQKHASKKPEKKDAHPDQAEAHPHPQKEAPSENEAPVQETQGQTDMSGW